MTYLMNLLADRRMRLDNIAYQLFLDVVNFYSCQDTKLMRYNDVTKQFWFIGRKLFHSKLIHYLLGYKHMGAFVEKMNAEKCLDMSRYELDPSTTKINFAVPSILALNTYSNQQKNISLKPKDIHLWNLRSYA